MKNKSFYAPLALAVSIFSFIMVLVISFLVAQIYFTNGQSRDLFTSVLGNKIAPSGDLLTSVLDKGEIRIGYVINPPWLIKDPNTGALSGIYYEAVEMMGKNLDLKMNWVEEAGWGTMIEGLDTKRYDIVVGGIWPSSTKSKRINFSAPLYYSVVGVYTRPGDDRFTDSKNINSKDITIATIDGETSLFIAKATFPNAKLLSLPQDAQISQMLLNVKTGKADVTFVEKAVAEEFLANNPDSLQNIVPDNPIRTFGNTIVIPKNQSGFESMINVAIGELLDNGTVDDLVKKYEKYPASFFPVTKSYDLSR